MLEKSFGLFFFLKQPKNEKIKTRFVYLRITVDGLSRELSTKRQWEVARWSQAIGRAAGVKEDAKTLNAYLDLLVAKVFEAKRMLVESNMPITADGLKNVLLGKEEKKRMVLELFGEHNSQMKSLTGREYSASTLTRYETTKGHIAAFIRWQYQKPDLELQDLDYEFIAQLAFWFKSVRKCNHNSTMKYIKNFKKIVLECVKKGWLPKDPFTGFKTNIKEVDRIALTKEELVAIAEKDLDNERLTHVRDIFLFSCYSGLAYIDVFKLKRSDIIKGVDGGNWIVIKRQKTDAPTRLPLLPLAQLIIDKYQDHAKCSNKNQVLPILTNQKMNSYLKEIADCCKVDKNLTFHIARHTFATTVTLSNGVPIETVSKMLGHKSLKQTQHYAKIVDLKISEDMKALKQKFKL